MSVFVFFGTRDFEFVLSTAVECDSLGKVYELEKSIEDTETAIRSWVDIRKGKTLLYSGVEGVFVVDPDKVVEIPHLSTFLSSASSMDFYFGIGVSLQDAKDALEWGFKNGEKIALFNQDMLKQDEDEESLFKAELQHPQEHGQVALDQEDLTSVVMDGLQKLKANAQEIEKLREQAPEVYATIRHLSQAMIAMARQISEVKKAATKEAMKKSEGQEDFESLVKAEMGQEYSDQMGTHQHYSNLSAQLEHMVHSDTKNLGNGFFHHVFEAPHGGFQSHTLSRSPDYTKPHVAQMHLETQEGSAPAVSTVVVHPDHKNKNYGKSLYMAALQHNGQLMSDSQMTGRASKAWGWLGSQPGVSVSKTPEGRALASAGNLSKSMKLPMLRNVPKTFRHKFPKPLEAEGDNSGPIHRGKIKSASIDQATGETKRVGWHSVRSGMVVGRSGQIVSSREPNTDD